MQQDRYILHVRPEILGGLHNQGRRHQGLFLKTVVGMHPMRAWAGRKAIGLCGARFDYDAPRFGYAIQ